MNNTLPQSDYEEGDQTSNVDANVEDKVGSIETTLIVQSKEKCGIRNEVTFKMRDYEYTVRGWKACTVEALTLGLVVAGAYFLASNAPDIAKSVGSTIGNALKRE